MQDMQAVYMNYRFRYPYDFDKEELAKTFLEANKKRIVEGEVKQSYTGKWFVSGIKGVQMGVRPWVPVEFTFPKEYEDKVLKLLHPENSWNSKFSKYLTIMRKLLGLKKIPKFNHKIETASPVRAGNMVEVAGIGLKEDRMVDGIEQL
jgi:hypothetical protein